jgi:hypothetical protein
MSWTSVGLISTTDDWQYTQPFVGDYIRIRHLLGAAQDDLPYGFTGLIAQAFNFENTVELYNIRKLYPFNQEDIFPVINPFPSQSRRLGIRGQKRYQTKINWRVVIDVWSGSELPNLNSLQQQLARLPIIEEKLDQILVLIGNPEEPQEASQAQQQFFFLQ